MLEAIGHLWPVLATLGAAVIALARHAFGIGSRLQAAEQRLAVLENRDRDVAREIREIRESLRKVEIAVVRIAAKLDVTLEES